MHKESKLFLNTKTATVAEARALKIGDVIEVVYADSSKSRLELVVQSCQNAKTGNWYDIRTIPLDCFGKRSNDASGPHYLNTNKFKKVGDLLPAARLASLHVEL